MTKPLNRKGRRAYEKKIKNDPDIYFCPECQLMTHHIKAPSIEYMYKKDFRCELCGNRTVKGI